MPAVTKESPEFVSAVPTTNGRPMRKTIPAKTTRSARFGPRAKPATNRAKIEPSQHTPAATNAARHPSVPCRDCPHHPTNGTANKIAADNSAQLRTNRFRLKPPTQFLSSLVIGWRIWSRRTVKVFAIWRVVLRVGMRTIFRPSSDLGNLQQVPKGDANSQCKAR